MAGRKLILREAVADDIPRILAAIATWKAHEEAQGKTNYVLPRPEPELRETAEKGLYFLVEDAATRQLLAVSGVFNLRAEPDVVVELGGTYVDDAIRKRGLQSVFFEIRVTTAMILNGSRVRLTTAIDPSNDDSYRNAVEKNLFVVTQPIPEQTGDACKTCEKPKGPQRECCCDFYDISQAKARELATRFYQRLRGNTIMLSRDDNQVEVDAQCQIVVDEDFRGAAQSFACGEWPKD